MVALDANGADRGPRNVAEGGLRAGVPVTIFGPAAELEGFDGVVDAPVAITNDEDPARAVRAKPDASMVQAARAVKDGRAGAFVTPGSTGAALAAGLFHLKRMRGVHRPAVAVRVPVPGRAVLLLDCGANVDSRPEWLVQFAYMGAAYMEGVHGVKRARVGLLSVGEEPKKGTDAVVEANRVLRDGPLNFAGNVEGGDLMRGQLDVVVTDGFTGNVALKTMEGLANMLVGALKTEYTRNPLRYIGAAASWPVLRSLRREFDPRTYNGASMVGLSGIVIKSHGSADVLSFRNAIRVGLIEARKGVPTQIANLLSAQLA
ncbi:MAG TPA: phosphate acyltransferase PlsX [Thermoleophilaceae bacterium]|nr:phosphate acyltransferase PlsX [Thermoleophilaceae bacterium]